MQLIVYLHKQKIIMEQWSLIEQSKQYKQVRFYISNYGRIKSINITNQKELICKTTLNEKGYPEMSRPKTRYCKKIKIKLHIEVAKHFVSGRFDGAVVNHKDKDRTNCHFSNLEYVTLIENNLHSHMKVSGSAVGLEWGKYPVSDYVASVSKPVNCFDIAGTLLKKYPSINETARSLGLSSKRVGEVLNGRKGKKSVKSYKGYIFQFA
jgi:hypothetical protein